MEYYYIVILVLCPPSVIILSYFLPDLRMLTRSMPTQALPHTPQLKTESLVFGAFLPFFVFLITHMNLTLQKPSSAALTPNSVSL